MASDTNPFRQHANSVPNPPDSPDTCNTKERSISEGVEAHGALPPPFSNPIPSSAAAKSPRSFPQHLLYRIPPPSPWTRLWRNNKWRIATCIFFFLVVVGGTIAGAFFLANVMRTGMFHTGSGASVGGATRTSHVTVITVVPGLGKEMGPVTETVWNMQETHLLTQWIVWVPKTTTTPVMPTEPADKSQ